MFQRCPNCEFAPYMKDCKVCNDTKINEHEPSFVG